MAKRPNPIFDIDVAVKRLEPIMRLQRERVAADFSSALPEVMRFARYRPVGGAALLLQDICAALSDLPVDPKLKVQDSAWGRLILGLDHPTDNITDRRDELHETNGSARKYRDRFVVQSVMHRLRLLSDEATVLDAMYDTGFDIVKIATDLRPTADNPRRIRHQVSVKVRARRPGLRIIPLCYGAQGRPILVEPNPRAKADVVYSGCSAIATGNSDLPIHFFWLTQPSLPGAVISFTVRFYEERPDGWDEVCARLRLLADSALHAVIMRASPSDAFRRVIGCRVAPGSSRGVVRFDSGPPGTPRRKLEYRPRAAKEETIFELRCIPSEEQLDAQCNR